MKVRTLPQPHASLVALGVQTMLTEDRAAPAELIGQRFGIGAAAEEPDGAGRLVVGSWEVGTAHGVGWAIWPVDRYGDLDAIVPLPLGCIVATAVLDDCVPMIEHGEEHPEGHSLLLSPPEFGMRLCRLSRANGGSSARLVNVEVQRPYGDFRPGRWAWLLRDVEPVTEKCPACHGAGVDFAVEFDRPPHFDPCPRCDGARRVDPIPFKGGPGLREWTP